MTAKDDGMVGAQPVARDGALGETALAGPTPVPPPLSSSSGTYTFGGDDATVRALASDAALRRAPGAHTAR